MRDFFISYNRADRTWAEWIAWQLEDAGYGVVIQAWDFLPGSNFVLEMHQALEEAQRVLALISPDYLASRFAQPEWEAAFIADPMSSGGQVLPVRVRDCEMPGLLATIVYIDLVNIHDEEVARSLILDGARQGRAKPLQVPQFPNAPRPTLQMMPQFPVALPEVWNVPYNRNRNFAGRNDLLRNLRASLVSRSHFVLPQVIHGLGGVGKTQLAVEYAYRYSGDYNVVWWIHADEPATLAGDFAALGEKVGLRIDAADRYVVIDAVTRWLREHRSWLLIFDNAQSSESIAPYLPSREGGHILITSRHPWPTEIASPLLVPVLERDDAVDFLLKHSGESDYESASQLVAELGSLPLALSQAAAYIEAHRVSVAEYLATFRKHRQNILGRGEPSTDYAATIEATWAISLLQVQTSFPAAADLLNLCAFLAPDDIPLTLIREAADQLKGNLAAATKDATGLDSTVNALLQHSLVWKVGDALSIHPLVQAVLRDRSSDRERWITTATLVIENAFPVDSNDMSTWPTSARLLPHVTAVSRHCERMNVALDPCIRLLTKAGAYLQVRGEYPAARSLLERAATLSEQVHGAKSTKVAIAVSNLGTVLREMGELTLARTYFERSLQIEEMVHGHDHPSTIVSHVNLGTILHQLGDLADARVQFEWALRITETMYGPDHPYVAVCVNNLGGVVQELGSLAEARELYERALQIDEKAYGSNHPQVAVSLNNLGSVLQDLGNLDEARRHYQQSLQINEVSYGIDHPIVAKSINNLGSLLRDLGDQNGARAHFERALQINESAYGPDHPTVAISLNNLAVINKLSGNLHEAREYLERAAHIDEFAYGPNHPQVATDFNNLSGVLADLGDLKSAYAYAKRALTIDMASYGEIHPTVAIRLNNLASVLGKMGQIGEAQHRYEQALEILNLTLGAEHPFSAHVQARLASVRGGAQ